jgi:hypothetical protein
MGGPTDVNVLSTSYYSALYGQRSMNASQRDYMWQQSRSEMIDQFVNSATMLTDGLSNAWQSQLKTAAELMLQKAASRVRAEAQAKINKITTSNAATANSDAFDRQIAKLKAYDPGTVAPQVNVTA